MKLLRRLWAAFLRLFRSEPKWAPRALPPGCQWVGHSGTRAQVRAMKQSCRRVVSMHDSESLAAQRRLSRVVQTLPNPPLATMRLAHAALRVSDQIRVPWAQTVGILLDQLEEK